MSHAIAGTASAMRSPRKQNCTDSKATPARNVPSASSIKSTRPTAGAVNKLCTRNRHDDVHRHQHGCPMKRLGSDQSKAAAPIRNRLPLRRDAHEPDHNREELPIADERLVRNVGIGDAENCEEERDQVRRLPPQLVPEAAGVRRRSLVFCRTRPRSLTRYLSRCDRHGLKTAAARIERFAGQTMLRVIPFRQPGASSRRPTRPYGSGWTRKRRPLSVSPAGLRRSAEPYSRRTDCRSAATAHRGW